MISNVGNATSVMNSNVGRNVSVETQDVDDTDISVMSWAHARTCGYIAHHATTENKHPHEAI